MSELLFFFSSFEVPTWTEPGFALPILALLSFSVSPARQPMSIVPPNRCVGEDRGSQFHRRAISSRQAPYRGHNPSQCRTARSKKLPNSYLSLITVSRTGNRKHSQQYFATAFASTHLS